MLVPVPTAINPLIMPMPFLVSRRDGVPRPFQMHVTMAYPLSPTKDVLMLIKKWELTSVVPASAVETFIAPELVSTPKTEAIAKLLLMLNPF